MATNKSSSSTREYSKVWRYFERTDSGGKCLVKGCGKAIKRSSTSTKGFWDHIRFKHRRLYAEIENENEDCTQSGNDGPEAGKGSNSGQSVQLKLSESYDRATGVAREQERLRDEAMLFIISDLNVPFTAANKPSIRRLLKRAFPRCRSQMPHRQYYATTALERAYKSVLGDVTADLRKKDFCVTSDLWSNKSASLCSLTVHYVTQDFTRRNAVFACVPCSDIAHTGDNIAKLIRERIEAQHISMRRMKAFVRDGGSNMVKAASALGLEKCSFQCAAHALHLAILHGISSGDGTGTIIAKCRRIAGFFNRSKKGRKLLRDELAKAKMRIAIPPQDVAVRWNSTHSLLEGVLHIRPVLERVATEMTGDTRALLVALTNQDFSILKALEKFLSKIARESRLLCCDNAVCSSYIPVFSILTDYCEKAKVMSLNDGIKEVICGVQSRLLSSLTAAKTNSLLRISVFLDPRYRRNATIFTEEEWNAIEQEVLHFGMQLVAPENPADELPRLPQESQGNATFAVAEDGTLERLNVTEREDEREEVVVHEADEDEEWAFNDIEDCFTETDAVVVEPESDNGDDELWQHFRSGAPPVEPLLRETSTIMSEELMIEVNRLKRFPVEPLDGNPFQWFTLHGPAFPHVARIARITMSVPPTSVASERLFSKATMIYANKQRSRLEEGKVEKLLLLQANHYFKPSESESESTHAFSPLFPPPLDVFSDEDDGNVSEGDSVPT